LLGGKPKGYERNKVEIQVKLIVLMTYKLYSRVIYHQVAAGAYLFRFSREWWNSISASSRGAL